MEDEPLEQNIKNAVIKLFDIAKEFSWNKISSNCFFILSEIKNNDEINTLITSNERNKINKNKTPITFDQMLLELKKLYSNLYDVNFYIYKAEKKRTIIEIQYLEKSSLNKGFFEKVKQEKPMIHSKISMPPYYNESKEKIDINWEHGGVKHNWKMFWWKWKLKKAIKKRRRDYL